MADAPARAYDQRLAGAPVYRDATVDRPAERAALDALLGAGKRLIVVHGPPGIGKSRLAVGWARDVPGPFTGRAFCGLTSCLADADLLPALVHGLGVPGGASGESDLTPALVRWLRARTPFLLLLDNAEGVAAPLGQRLASWLEACPELYCLVTSRVRLSSDAEAAVQLGPLALPDRADADGVLTSPAVRLFLERARDRLFAPDDPPAHAGAVRAIVTHLEGNPLAIELAAKRLALLPLEELARRLGQRFDVLRDPAAGAPSRQTAFWHALDWSYQLLEPWERVVLQWVSVFRGGFSLEAAEAVLAGAPGLDNATVLDGLHSLCDKSLLRLEPAEQGPRFQIYEAIREFADAALATDGSRPDAFARHASYFLARAREAAGELDGPHGLAQRAWFRAELENVSAVLERARAATPTAASLRDRLEAVLVLAPYLWRRSLNQALLDISSGVEEIATGDDRERDRRVAWILLWRGRAGFSAGQQAASRRELGRCLELARQIGDPALEGLALAAVAHHDLVAGDLEATRRRYEAALALHRTAGDRRNEGIALGNLAMLDMLADFDRAEARCLDALALLEEVGDDVRSAQVLLQLGTVAMQHDRWQKSRQCLERASSLDSRYGEVRHAAMCGTHLGLLNHLEGRLGEARAAFDAALPPLREVGERRYVAALQTYVGLLALEDARYADAAAHLEEAVSVASALRALAHLAAARGALSLAYAATDRTDEAARELDEARALLAQLAGYHMGDIAELHALSASLLHGDDGALRRRVREWLQRPDWKPVPEVRLAARVLDAVLRRADERARTWRIHVDGQWFQPAGEAVVGLQTRKPLAALVAALAEARCRAPGEPLSGAMLFEAGWPGIRLPARSAANRLHVTLNELRRAGLKALLLSSRAGYMLDPAIPLERVADS